MTYSKLQEYIRSLEVIVYDIQESLAHDILDEEEYEEEEFRLEWFDNELDKLYNALEEMDTE